MVSYLLKKCKILECFDWLFFCFSSSLLYNRGTLFFTIMYMTLPENAKRVFQWITFDVYQWPQEMFDGSLKTFEKLRRIDSADIIAITEDGKICILEEEQPARPPFFWLIAWSGEEWEEPLMTAQRELLEELWMISEDWTLLNSYSESSRMEYKDHLFIARSCRVIQSPQLESGEKIKLRKVEWKEFLDIVADPRFRFAAFALDALRYIYLWKEEELKQLIFKGKK